MGAADRQDQAGLTREVTGAQWRGLGGSYLMATTPCSLAWRIASNSGKVAALASASLGLGHRTSSGTLEPTLHLLAEIAPTFHELPLAMPIRT